MSGVERRAPGARVQCKLTLVAGLGGGRELQAVARAKLLSLKSVSLKKSQDLCLGKMSLTSAEKAR